MAGRPRKPTAIKEAQGTSRKCRTLNNEMQPAKYGGIPAPPEVLSRHDRAMKLWNSSINELVGLDMLYVVDMGMLAAYCLKMSIFFEMEEFLSEHGRVDEKGKRRAEDIISRDSLDQANKICQQFGFTPAARTKISMPNKKKEDEYFD